MKMRKLAAATMTLTLTTLSLVGCGNGNDSTRGNAEDERVQLTIATWANSTEADELNEILEQLNDSQGVYEITQTVIPQDYYTKIQTMIAGNQAPDFMWLSQEHIPAYATNGAIVDMKEKLDLQTEIDMSDYLEGALDTAKYQGDIYGLPWIAQPYVVYYNQTMFEEAGLDTPSLDWTWDDFKEVASQLTSDDVYGFGSTGNPPTAVFAWGEGGDIIDEAGNVQIDSEGTIRGLEVMNSILDSDFTMPYSDISSIGTEQAFINGEIAMMVGGANDNVERNVEGAGGAFDVGMAMMPSGSEEQVTFSWTASTVISSQTENEEVAMQALLDLTNAMFDWKIPTPVESKLTNIAEINPYKEYAIDIILQSAEIARGFHNMPEQNGLGGIQWEQLDELILTNNNGRGDVDVEAMARETADSFRAVLGQ